MYSVYWKQIRSVYWKQLLSDFQYKISHTHTVEIYLSIKVQLKNEYKIIKRNNGGH
jgi:hypothetical protein